MLVKYYQNIIKYLINTKGLFGIKPRIFEKIFNKNETTKTAGNTSTNIYKITFPANVLLGCQDEVYGGSCWRSIGRRCHYHH